MRILLTGFGPFGSFAVNPSAEIVRAIAGNSQALGFNDLVAEVLPTEFLAAGDRIRRLIREVAPDACVCLGVCDEDSTIRLEQVAFNRDEAGAPDASGRPGSGGPIVPDGPEAYFSTLPLARFQQVLEQLGVGVSTSDDAGGYVCNHVFYLACHEMRVSGSNASCGFLHIPPISGGAVLQAVVLQAVVSCLAVLQESPVAS